MSDLPVVVIGAGPQGLAAAAHLLERGLEPLVLESGDGRRGGGRVGARPAVLVVAGAGRPGVGPAAGGRPAGRAREGYPTGAEWVEGYLAPLAATLGDRVRYDARVTGSRARAGTGWSTPAATNSRSPSTWSTARATSPGWRRAR